MREIIHIDWEGPFTLTAVKSLDGDTDYGIYQIYGGHPVYGCGVLLYIGKAAEQTFATRIAQEGWERNRDSGNVQVYVGRLSGPETPDEEQWSRQISRAEQLLIYAHAPGGNSKNIATIRENEIKDIHVFNWMSYRDLFPEVSGERWKDVPEDVDNFVPYGTR